MMRILYRIVGGLFALFAMASAAHATDPWTASLYPNAQRPENYSIIECWDPGDPTTAKLCGNTTHPLIVQLTGTLPLPADGATGTKQDTGNASLASILAKLSSDPATQTTLAAILAKLTSDPATQTTLAAVLAKLSSDPATQTTLAAILAKLTNDPATQTTLAAILAKLTSDPATQTTLASIDSKLTSPLFVKPQTGLLTHCVTTTVESSRTCKGSAAAGYRFSITTGSIAGYFLIYDATAPPSNGTVTPFSCTPVGAYSRVEIDHANLPDTLATGLVLAFSTTGCTTQTLSATAFFEASYQ